MNMNTTVAKDKTLQQKLRPKKPSRFFSETELQGLNTSSNGTGAVTMSLHDQALLEQIGGIINDVLDEVRNEYRLACIHQGIVGIKELAPPYTFQSTTCMEWIQNYFKQYSKMDSPDCYIPGTEPPEPKIDKKFKYYYQMGIFNSPIKVGRLLMKCHQYCGIVLASNYGNRKNWILNPPK